MGKYYLRRYIFDGKEQALNLKTGEWFYKADASPDCFCGESTRDLYEAAARAFPGAMLTTLIVENGRILDRPVSMTLEVQHDTD